MKLGGRLLGAGALVVGAALLPGCGEDLSSPVAPTPIETPTDGEVIVKTDTAPVPIEPITTSEADEITDRQPLLVASNATGLVPVTFGYEFAVYPAAASGGSAAVDSGFGMPHDANSISYQVQEPLALGTDYTWRVRVTYEDRFGAWSVPAPFSIAPIVFGSPPQLVAPERGSSVGIRPVFTVRNGEIDGEAQRVQIQVRLAPEGTELADTHIVGTTETEGRAGEEVMIQLGGRQALTPGRVYDWQARAVAHAASRRFHGPWSQSWSFETVELSLGAPEPITPPQGATVGIRPTFHVRNGAVDGDVGPVVILVQVAVDGNKDGVSDDDFARAIEGRAPMQGSRGDTSTVQLDQILEPMTSYVWRTQAVAPRASHGPIRSPWSSPDRGFETRAGGGDYPLGPVRNPPPNLRHIIQRVANDRPDALRAALDGPIVGTPRRPNDPRYEFLGLAVQALREANGGRWGTCFWIHPGFPDNLSRDRVAYFLGDANPVDSQNFRVIEFLYWADGSIFWWDSTEHLREEYPNAIGYWRNPPGSR